jgi:predicted XRE-type DNA-binding protein
MSSCWLDQIDLATESLIYHVSETVYFGRRQHLTEKTFKPIAMGMPFILNAPAGSLAYLKSYGFKTFDSVWDESYDLVEDPAERLIQIAELMKYISSWNPEKRNKKIAEAQAIADYNKKHFFSQEFFDLVIGELKTNLKSAINHLETTNTSKSWCAIRTKLIRNQDRKKTRTFEFITRDEVASVIRKARQYLRR